MDTKSRAALFVGGVVLVGLVAWVLMPTKKTAEPLVDNSVQSTGDLAAAPATQPTTRPVAMVDPFAAPTTQPSVAPVAIGPATPAVSNNDAWARALDGNTSSSTSTLMAPAKSSMDTAFGGSATSAAAPKTYKVAASDSLYTISEKVYGSGKYSTRILAANPGLNPKHLKIGQEIKLPDINADVTAATPTITVPSASETPAVASRSATAAEKTYKVQSGDTLRKIATKVYGSSAMWEKVYSVNKKQIGSDPSNLRAGMVLQLPEGAH